MRCRLPVLSVTLLSLMPTAFAQDLLMVADPAQAVRPGLELKLRGDLFAANDTVPVSKFGNKLWPTDYRTRDGTNRAIGMWRWDVGGNERGWSMGYFRRQDWLLRANRDTVDAYALNQRGQLLAANRRYDLDYALRGFDADGVRLGRSWSLALDGGSGVVWGASASLLRGRGVRIDEVNVNLVSISV